MKIKIVKLYGLIYVFVLAAIVATGQIYISNINEITSKRITLPVTDKIIKEPEQDLAFVKGTTTPPVDLMKVGTPSQESVEKGKILYETNCSSCHGSNGTGDGPAGKTLNPPPRNFIDLKGWTNGTGIFDMYNTLQEGIASRGMAQYNNIPPEDRFAIIHYIRTFNKDYPKIEESDLNEIDNTYNLSSGMKQPSQIPVRVAMEKLIAENSDNIKRISDIKNQIIIDKNSRQAILFKNICTDLNMAVTSLYFNKEWNANEVEFVKFITTESVTKGFKTNIFELSSEDLNVLFKYIKLIYEK